MKGIFLEFNSILKNRWKAVLLLLVPLMITIYFDLLFQQGTVQQIRTVIVDQDQSSLSRGLTQEFANQDIFRIVQYSNNLSEAEEAIKKETADFIVYVPPKFNQDLKEGRSVACTVIADTSNMAVSSTALKAASQIVLGYNAMAQVSILEGKGYSKKESLNLAMPITFEHLQLANPSGNYPDFLIWGLIGATGHFPLMLLSASALKDADEKSKWTTVLQKIFVYAFLCFCELTCCFLVTVGFFPVTFTCSIVYVLLLNIFFALAAASFGVFLSAVIPSPFVATELSVIIALPALVISGFTWPISKFPWHIQILGWAEPLTYYVNPLREVLLNSVPTPYFWNCLLVLGSMFMGFTLTSSLVFGRKVRKWQKQALAA
ncbi:ABC transporter permease [Bacillota bacterium LX-D]|nr:ABC transporter permease [Bacillota bacterium LX-D]